MIQINQDWDEVLAREFSAPYFQDLWEKVESEYETARVYPAKENIFNALRFTPYHKVKVVLLGQDPYHGEGQAHGFAFSVQPGTAFPPSLQNIYKEIKADLGLPVPETGCLIPWAEQGVLLLNTVLTVRDSEPNSHKKLGWTTFTDAVISALNDREEPVIFLLWGANAKEKLPLITNSRHYVLSSAHPSPLSASRGFFGCRHFSKVNTILERLGKETIDWSL
ncbi:MAG: uracil-DNA glycosylase [Clostridia bacterium]|nr:uracil-DNA glycosylase [Clostridia bacterium]